MTALSRLRTPRPSWGYICDRDPIPGGCVWTYRMRGAGPVQICGKRLSRLRWVLHGHCGQHGDGR